MMQLYHKDIMRFALEMWRAHIFMTRADSYPPQQTPNQPVPVTPT